MFASSRKVKVLCTRKARAAKMGSANVKIRVAQKADAVQIQEIYGFYAKNTFVTFAQESPPIEHWEETIEQGGQAYPFFVAEDSAGTIVGFTYASKLRPHDAYRWNVELTLYLSDDAPKRRGIGRALFEAIEVTLAAQGIKFIWAVVTAQNKESIAFHEAMGFSQVAIFPDIGCKGGKWLSVVWLRKQLSELHDNPSEPLPFSRLSPPSSAK